MIQTRPDDVIAALGDHAERHSPITPHVSPGCDNCYAEAMAHRRGWHDWSTGPRKTLSDAYWRQPLVWNRKAQNALS